MTVTSLSDYVDQAEKIGKDAWLGSLVWYSVIEAMIPHADVLKALEDSGLTDLVHESLLPRCPKDFDVFLRVSSNAGLKKVPVTGSPDKVRNYLIREVSRESAVIVRRLVCETKDAKAKDLSYNTDLCDVEFNRDTSTIKTRWLSPSAQFDPNVNSIVETIRSEFKAQRGRLNAYAIRELLRKLVLHFGGTCVREGGGVYFLQQSRASEIEALEKFVSLLPGYATFHPMPLVDDSKQRDMVKRAFEADTCDTIHRTLGEIEEWLTSGKKISVDKYGKMLAEYREVKDRTTGYADLLETGLIETHSALDLYELQLKQLRRQMKDDNSDHSS